ncbi:hypothetical protein ZWY2020_055618 [Hordeum vulgare]|nr:hypothetical protein ZWY2020_055618 [Hordeum vulgare]
MKAPSHSKCFLDFGGSLVAVGAKLPDKVISAVAEAAGNLSVAAAGLLPPGDIDKAQGTIWLADEATVVLPCLEVVLPSVEHEKTETVTESALTAVLPCLEVVLPSVELQTEEVEQCVPSTQSAKVQTEEVGHGQVQKLRGPSGVVGKNTKSISINKLCAVEPNIGKKEKKSSGRKKQKK